MHTLSWPDQEQSWASLIQQRNDVKENHPYTYIYVCMYTHHPYSTRRITNLTFGPRQRKLHVPSGPGHIEPRERRWTTKASLLLADGRRGGSSHTGLLTTHRTRRRDGQLHVRHFLMAVSRHCTPVVGPCDGHVIRTIHPLNFNIKNILENESVKYGGLFNT